MADKSEQEQAQKDQAPKEEKWNSKKKENVIAGSIMAGIILVFALAGFFLGEVLVETLQPEPIVASQFVEDGPSLSGQQAASPNQDTSDNEDPGDTWFYELAPLTANLDEPGATRYVRAALTLEMLDSLDPKEGKDLLDEKAPHMRNWLAIYMASLSLEDAQGERNLRRIQSDVLVEFNQILFQNDKPHVNYILLKDFAIQ